MRSTGNQFQHPRQRPRLVDSLRGWFGRFSSVTHFIITLTVVVFVVQLVCQLFRWETENGLGIVESLLGLSGTRLMQGFVWEIVTYMLVHGGIWHILINLLLLWMFGREVEYFIGPKAFIKLYLLAGMLGGALWLAFNFDGGQPLVGASAAVLGCVIAFATLFPERELTFLIFFVIPVTLRAKYMALIAIAFDVVPLLTHAQTNVAHLAHLGGAVVGYLYIKGLGYGVTPRWLVWIQSFQYQSVKRPDRPKQPRAVSREDFIRNEIDPILDKISREGMQSLTREERKTLESAKDLLEKNRR